MPEARSRMIAVARSFAAKAVVLAAILVVVPVIIYQQLHAAHEEKRELLLRSVQEQGRLIAQGLESAVAGLDGNSLPSLNETLDRFGSGGMSIKVLFRPNEAERKDSFFYVAAWPATPAQDPLQDELENLARTGALNHLDDQCQGNVSLALHYTNPAGRDELITSLTPIQTEAGCWVVITAHQPLALLAPGSERPYWATPEMRFGAAIYVVMVAIVLSLFLGAWRGLRRFVALARHIRTRGPGRASFGALNLVPELDPAAREFDQLVQTLHRSSEAMRAAAEENAHSFKTPIAVITQALEPLRRDLAPGDVRAERAIQMIEKSVARLDELVGAARHSETLAAELMTPSMKVVDLGRFLTEVADGFEPLCEARSVMLSLDLVDGPPVFTNPDLLEAAVENVVDNAVSFTPPGRAVALRLRYERGGAVVAVDDQGTGVPPKMLPHIFDRSVSSRAVEGNGNGDLPHFGLGLWIVQRNMEALGGRAAAANRPEGGLRVTLRLPIERN